MRDHPILTEASRHGVRLGLNRMRSFLQALGSPHLVVPTLHVAGTNGKGSVVRMVASLLEAHGRSTGELTSPHLQEVNERIRYRGQPVSDAELEALLAELIAVRDTWAAAEGLPQSPGGVPEAALLTYFEITTAAGFLHLAHKRPDAAVVEVGMGGRLDATNLVAPVVTAIVSIGIDHTAELGPDLGSIAAEKAGIAKPGVPMVLGPMEHPALRVIRAMAADRGAPLLLPDEHYRVAADRQGLLHFSMGDTLLDGLPLALPGAHQIHNAGVALAMVQTFLGPEHPLDPAACAQALADVHHAGRLEWLGPDLLLGVSSDKDPRSMVVALEGVVDRVITTQCAHPRALPAGSLAEALVGVGVPVLPAGPVEQALPMARRGGGLVIAAGSIFLSGAVRELVGAGRDLVDER